MGVNQLSGSQHSSKYVLLSSNTETQPFYLFNIYLCVFFCVCKWL